jgi:hypothetical protein
MASVCQAGFAGFALPKKAFLRGSTGQRIFSPSKSPNWRVICAEDLREPPQAVGGNSRFAAAPGWTAAQKLGTMDAWGFAAPPEQAAARRPTALSGRGAAW